MTLHQTLRVKHEARRRNLTVEAVEALTPGMLRISFVSPDLHDFASAAADDHIKLFFPIPGERDANVKLMRDFTPRSFDTAARRLVIDFALHDGGPAINWARAAKVGDTLEIGGPRGSKVIPDDFEWYLLIGDETALPAIGRRVEETRSEASVITVALISGSDEAQSFQSNASVTSLWAIRRQEEDEFETLRETLDQIELPAGDGFIWIAAEATTARALRSYVVGGLGHPREWVKAGGYWVRGQANAHEKID